MSGAALPALVVYSATALTAFLFAVGLTALYQHRDYLTVLFYETALARYEVMSGERGPATFLVFHDDYAALEAVTSLHTDILGIEPSEFDNVAKMAFVSVQSPLVTEVANMQGVRHMVNKHIPMLCH